MLEYLKNPKEWTKIARNFSGRTQHQIKNRFIRVLSMGLCLKRKKIVDLMKINSIVELIYETLKNLKLKKQEKNPLFYSQQKNEETDGNESNEIKEIRMSSLILKRNAFNDNFIDSFFYEHNGEQNREGFINYDFITKTEPIN